jgi:hypothetical protein
MGLDRVFVFSSLPPSQTLSLQRRADLRTCLYAPETSMKLVSLDVISCPEPFTKALHFSRAPLTYSLQDALRFLLRRVLHPQRGALGDAIHLGDEAG